jgi:hypothetical protein
MREDECNTKVGMVHQLGNSALSVSAYPYRSDQFGRQAGLIWLRTRALCYGKGQGFAALAMRGDSGPCEHGRMCRYTLS